MSEWKLTTLGDIIQPKGYIRGPFGSSLKRNEMRSEGIPVYEQKNAIYNERSFRFYIDKQKFDELKRFQVKTDDLIISCSGTVGKISIIKEEDPKGIISQALLIVRPNNLKIKLNFLFYFLTSNLGYELITQASHGSVQINIAERKVVEKIPILLPPLPEQTAIESILSSLDNKIDLLNRQNATLEKMAETLFRQWFIEEAKEEWKEIEIGNLIDVVIDNRGKTPPTVEYPTDYPLIEVNALNSNSCLVDYSVIRKYVTKEIYDTWFRKHLMSNDFIISTVGTIGIFSIHLANKGCIAQNLVGLRSSKISSFYLYCFFKTNIETLINLDIGGVQPSIKVPHLLGLTIKLSPNELLKNFDKNVEPYFNKIAKNQSQIRTLTSLRDTLLPKLMSGEVRVEY